MGLCPKPHQTRALREALSGLSPRQGGPLDPREGTRLRFITSVGEGIATTRFAQTSGDAADSVGDVCD